MAAGIDQSRQRQEGVNGAGVGADAHPVPGVLEPAGVGDALVVQRIVASDDHQRGRQAFESRRLQGREAPVPP